MDHAQLTDDVLLSRITQHDTEALAALYDRHAQTIYSLALRITRDISVADEVLQDTFWEIWRKADSFQASGVAAAWLYRIARNKSLDQLRRSAAQSRQAGEPISQQIADQRAGVEQTAELRWMRQQVQQALERLPDDQRQCLELAYFEGMSQRQIAEHIDAPIGTVKGRVRLGLEKLERLLRAAGYRAEDANL